MNILLEMIKHSRPNFFPQNLQLSDCIPSCFLETNGLPHDLQEKVGLDHTGVIESM